MTVERRQSPLAKRGGGNHEARTAAWQPQDTPSRENYKALVKITTPEYFAALQTGGQAGTPSQGGCPLLEKGWHPPPFGQATMNYLNAVLLYENVH